MKIRDNVENILWKLIGNRYKNIYEFKTHFNSVYDRVLKNIFPEDDPE